MDALAASLLSIADWITAHITMWVLVGTGLFLTIRTRGVQVRHLPDMFRAVTSSRAGAHGGISSFQAFAISLAARVGVGNIFGVAAALLMGGPGAVFWMWVVALVGMATAFFEATLAQIFKVRAGDGSFRGGPAYYMRAGVGSPALAGVYAVITLVTCGFVITSVQSNAVAGTLLGAIGDDGSAIEGFGGFSAAQLVIAALVFVFTAMVIFGGIRTVARVTEWMAPIMAGIYIVLVFIICLMHLGRFVEVLGLIISSAFAPQPLVGGLGGGILAAVVNGTKRGLFSNEAGQGTAPNAAATATVAHPVQQGLIQSLGVFIDTIVVCTATAFVILIAGPEVWGADGANPSTLTIMAVSHELGGWTILPIAVLIFVLAYSSIIAAYVYSDTNMSFLTGGKTWATWTVRVVSVVSATAGAVLSLDVVWNAVDIAMAVMTVTNLVALILLSKWGVGALRDWEAQRRAGVEEPVFVGHDNPHLPADVPGDVWN
ncbi:MAG: alanine:cation symporter family protein [Actinomyces succiniciruminis]|uniref:Amino-acid carrier protein AlsT n=1 Tax=Actinomyces succiniciruminis TaxID=1522002 RepID=A0A1L7RC62_9ACTO|nr:alanine/glycine:cation symporter family protein [Actinomyces succiniciruminis]MBE6474188.1 alanine:cation symporter family protein [Actinomyces succiniciruminis]MBM6978914.1 alanine:cation symporter family protein [Actinomyces succiniciruminis]CED91517.1 Amino-acid carrier protein AlsT [Actinomyces succiniciruminis]